VAFTATIRPLFCPLRCYKAATACHTSYSLPWPHSTSACFHPAFQLSAGRRLQQSAARWVHERDAGPATGGWRRRWLPFDHFTLAVTYSNIALPQLSGLDVGPFPGPLNKPTPHVSHLPPPFPAAYHTDRGAAPPTWRTRFTAAGENDDIKDGSLPIPLRCLPCPNRIERQERHRHPQVSDYARLSPACRYGQAVCGSHSVRNFVDGLTTILQHYAYQGTLPRWVYAHSPSLLVYDANTRIRRPARFLRTCSFFRGTRRPHRPSPERHADWTRDGPSFFACCVRVAAAAVLLPAVVLCTYWRLPLDVGLPPPTTAISAGATRLHHYYLPMHTLCQHCHSSCNAFLWVLPPYRALPSSTSSWAYVACR